MGGVVRRRTFTKRYNVTGSIGLDLQAFRVLLKVQLMRQVALIHRGVDPDALAPTDVPEQRNRPVSVTIGAPGARRSAACPDAEAA